MYHIVYRYASILKDISQHRLISFMILDRNEPAELNTTSN